MGRNRNKRHKLKGRSTSHSNERMGENTRKTRERGGKGGATLKGACEMVLNFLVKETWNLAPPPKKKD